MSKKPNILIIMADQQRYDTIGAAGYSHMITPNLDRLCKEGCIFTHAHSHNPVCMPARHDLLTGMPACAHGYFNNSEATTLKDHNIPTLARMFSENGYRTASIGKMHFNPVRAHHGYGEMYTMEEIPRCRQDDDYAMELQQQGEGCIQNIHGIRPLAYHTPQKSLVSFVNYETRWVQEKTVEWLDRNDKSPFLLFVGYIKPHPPWDIPQEYEGLYKEALLPPVIPRTRCYPNHEEVNEWYGDMDTQEQLRKNREAYMTSCTLVDESIGYIIEYLRKTGELDNTMIIYTSDHGEMLGDKGYYSKNLPYESSVRIPLIVRYPNKFQPNSANGSLVDLMDIFPTCLEVAGIDYPKGNYSLYGESLLDTDSIQNRDIIISANGFLDASRWVMARSKEHKYIYRYNRGYEEWYDLTCDGHEEVNCIDAMKESVIYQRLRTAVEQYEKEYGPKGAIEHGKLIVFDGEPHEGHKNGKYHKWCNSQFQKFWKGSKEEYGDRFIREIKEAFSNEEISGCKMNEIFQNPEWKEWFRSSFEQVAIYDGWKEELFQDES